MKKQESIFEVHIEDIIGALTFAVLFLYFYIVNRSNMNFQTWMDTIIYPAMVSIIVFAIVYFIRKSMERGKK
ncbi:MAG: hypothetical protein ACUVQX_03185 [Candidatus Bathycorpusculaceae bacterium]